MVGMCALHDSRQLLLENLGYPPAVISQHEQFLELHLLERHDSETGFFPPF